MLFWNFMIVFDYGRLLYFMALHDSVPYIYINIFEKRSKVSRMAMSEY